MWFTGVNMQDNTVLVMTIGLIWMNREATLLEDGRVRKWKKPGSCLEEITLLGGDPIEGLFFNSCNFLNYYFLLEGNCFIMLWWSLPYINVYQS